MPNFLGTLRHYRDEALAILNSRTGRQTRTLFFAELFNAALGFAVNVFVIHKLSVNDYGTFTLFSSALMLLAGFSHFGWNETFVYFGSKFRTAPFAGTLNRTFFLRMFLCAGAVTGAAALLSHFIARDIYHRPDFSTYLLLAAFGAILLTTLSFTMNYLRIAHEFTRYSVMQSAHTITRVVALLALLASGHIEVMYIILIYTFAPFLPLALQLPKLAQSFRAGRAALAPELRREIMSYNNWLLVSIFTTTVIGNIDSHFLAGLHTDNRQLADFGVATRLTLPVNFVINALTTALLPKLSAQAGGEGARIYLNKLKKFLIPFATTMLIVGLLSVPLLERVAGAKYQDIENLMRLQFVSLFLIVLVNPFGLYLYAHGKARLLALMNVAQVVADLALDWLLIPKYGATGAILATIGINLLGLVCVYYWTFQHIKEKSAA